MRKLLCFMALGLAVCLPMVADATILEIADPVGTTNEIGARIRWGATGFEASIFDSNPFGQTPTLNPTGTPFCGVGNAYKFQVLFNNTTGALELSVDFNLNNSFGAGEVILRNTFNAPPRTDYTGYGFKYLSISGNEGSSTARSTISNLVINGTSLTSLTPNGSYLERFYKDSSGGLMAPITITGDLTFLTSGTSQERPSWNFNFKDSAVPAPVPLPGAVLLLGAGMARLVAYARRRREE